MQEVFYKIIEKFSNIHRVVKNDDDLEWNRAVYKCTEIVKQEAEQCNNGWIPVSERLPENISTVIIQVKEIEKPTFGWYGNKRWRLAEEEFVEFKDFTVVAWQPLPPKYQPKGE